MSYSRYARRDAARRESDRQIASLVVICKCGARKLPTFMGWSCPVCTWSREWLNAWRHIGAEVWLAEGRPLIHGDTGLEVP